LQKDNGRTVTVTRNGSGLLLLDTFNASNSLNSTTFAAGSGTIVVSSATGTTPVPGATLAVSGPTGVLRIGSAGGATSATFSNNIRAFASGTVQHSATSTDTLSGSITVDPGQNLTFNVTGGRLFTSGGISANGAGAGLIKSGANLMRSTTAVNTANITMNAGRYEITGPLNLFNNPVLNGGTLALLNTSGVNSLPNPLIVSGAGTLEARPAVSGTTAPSCR
jgi:hypothetical protein